MPTGNKRKMFLTNQCRQSLTMINPAIRLMIQKCRQNETTMYRRKLTSHGCVNTHYQQVKHTQGSEFIDPSYKEGETSFGKKPARNFNPLIDASTIREHDSNSSLFREYSAIFHHLLGNGKLVCVGSPEK